MPDTDTAEPIPQGNAAPDFAAIRARLVELSEQGAYRMRMDKPERDREWALPGKRPLVDAVLPDPGRPRRGWSRTGIMRMKVQLVVQKDPVTHLTYEAPAFSTTYRYHLDAIEIGDNWVIKDDPARRNARVEWARAKGHPVPHHLLNTAPERGDALGSLLLDARCGAETFEDFCGDLGYDTDSRRALDVYHACQKALAAMRRLFGAHYDEAVQLANEL